MSARCHGSSDPCASTNRPTQTNRFTFPCHPEEQSDEGSAFRSPQLSRIEQQMLRFTQHDIVVGANLVFALLPSPQPSPRWGEGAESRHRIADSNPSTAPGSPLPQGEGKPHNPRKPLPNHIRAPKPGRRRVIPYLIALQYIPPPHCQTRQI